MSADASLYWNATIGLFRKPGPGHTAPVAEAPAVHSLPETFIRFAIDAQLGCLELDKFDRALDALAAVQVRDPQHPLYGCLRWYYEEEEPIDTNASFFTGLTLLVVEYCQRSAIPDDIRDKLQVIFQGLFHWFTKELAESKLHYPNKHLGDLVCAWLLAEYLADEDALRHLEVQFAQAETYWKATHWGWGEHLSQVYTTVMLTEISVLLVMQKRLPKALFDALRAMADELLVLQDYFGSNAWVPTIRCYAFTELPAAPDYRSQVRPWRAVEDADYLRTLPSLRFMRVCFGQFLHDHGWHELFPPSKDPKDSALRVPTLKGQAVCWKRGSVRLGSLSHYPLKREWDQLRWGLSWQTFPVALSIDGCLWAFPQWHVSWQNGAERFHPARVKSDGYLRNALVPEDPCFTGETLASQEGAVCSIQRRLPEWHPSWVGASDSWVFVLTAKVEPVIYTTGGESVLELSIGTTSVKLHCRSPEGCVPKLSILEDGLSLRWELLSPASLLANR